MHINRREFLKVSAAAGCAALLSEPALAWGRWLAPPHRPVYHPRASFFDVVDFEFQPGARETYYGNFVSQKADL